MFFKIDFIRFISCFQEIFQGKRYKIELLPNDDDMSATVHQLTVSKPMAKDMGKYTCTCNEIQTGSYLDVEGKKDTDVIYSSSCLYTYVSLAHLSNHDFERNLTIFVPCELFWNLSYFLSVS